jgi:hypothetical protein
MFDSSIINLGGSGFDWYFALGPDTSAGHVQISNATYVVGRQGEGTAFTTWFAAATLVDSAKQTSGLWRVGSMYYPVTATYYDSAGLDQSMLQAWRDTAWDEGTRHGIYTLQMIKLEYDTTQPAVRFGPRDRAIRRQVVSVNGVTEAAVFDVRGRVVHGMARSSAAALPARSGFYIVRAKGAMRMLPWVQVR